MVDIIMKDQIEQIELNIKQAKEMVALGNCLESLRNNKSFRKLIIEGYFEKEAVRLVHLKSDYNMQTEESQKSIDTQMFAIGSLSQYFNTIAHQAMLAEKAIEDDEATVQELLAEELE
jgi:cysteinyl-tRNA synthetase